MAEANITLGPVSETIKLNFLFITILLFPRIRNLGAIFKAAPAPNERGLSRQFFVQISAQNLSQILNV